MIRVAVVLRDSISVAVVLLQMFDGLLDGGPGVFQESRIFSPGEHIIAPYHQHKLAVEVFPVIGVLPTELIRNRERVFLRHAKIMRHGSLGFSHAEFWFTGLERLPNPEVLAGQIFRHGVGKLAQNLLVEVGPEFCNRHRAVKQHVESGVIRVVVALHEGKRIGGLGCSSHRFPPERTTIGHDVHLVKKHATIPERLRFIIDVRCLPGINGVAPANCGGQSILPDFPGIGSARAIKIRVASIPFASGAKFNYREIPRDHYGDHSLLTRF